MAHHGLGDPHAGHERQRDVLERLEVGIVSHRSGVRVPPETLNLPVVLEIQDPPTTYTLGPEP